MIGWVPHVIVGFLDDIGGVKLRRSILLDAGLNLDESNFRLDEDIPDPACRHILDSACKLLEISELEAFTLFAPYFLNRARNAFPGFFKNIIGTREFLLRQPKIHNCIAAGLSCDAQRSVEDKFYIDNIPEGVRVYYNSPNRFAGLYISITYEIAKNYGEKVNINFDHGGIESKSCIMNIIITKINSNSFIKNNIIH